MKDSQLKIKTDKNGNIDFDSWSEIAKTDPETFEAMRREVIDNFIDSVPEERQRRLRGLQWQIDCLRARAGNPLSACIQISRMMWDTFQQLGEVSRDLTRPGPLPARPPAPEATVLAFRAPASRERQPR